MGAAVERLAAHEWRGLAWDSELEQHLAVEHDLADEMAPIVGQKHRVVRRHVYAVGSGILALAPGAQKIAVAIEDHHRMLAAVEGVDAIVAVDTDGGDLFERPAVGQFRPLGVDPVSELAASDDHRTPPCTCIRLPWSIAIRPVNASAALARIQHC